VYSGLNGSFDDTGTDSRKHSVSRWLGFFFLNLRERVCVCV